MKILQIIDSLSVGGAEMMTINISNLLQENGHEITLVHTREDDTLIKKSKFCKQIFLNKNPFIDIFAFLSY